MTIALCCGLSLALAWLRGAPPLRLADIRVRWLPLPVAAFAMQYILFVHVGAAASGYALLAQIGSAALLCLFLAANLHYRTLLLVIAGVLLNLSALAANGGYMPVRPADLVRIGVPHIAERLEMDGTFQKSTVLDEHTRLPWLADVIYLPMPIPPARMISPGDVLVGIGLFLFFQEAMVPMARVARVAGMAPAGGRATAARLPISWFAWSGSRHRRRD